MDKHIPGFEDYLQEVHSDLFPTVLDDDGPDHFDDWIGSLDVDDVMKYAEEAMKKAYTAGFERAGKIALDAITYKPKA